MRLRLYHHTDGARIAYREAGTGPALVLLHSLGLTHREWEPLVEPLAGRFRLVLPDLPLHGDSEDRPRHPYTREWMVDVISGFCRETAGVRPLLGGHDLGAELLLWAAAGGRLRPGRLVVMPTRLHRAPPGARRRAAWRAACRGAAVPGLDRALSHGARLVFRPALGERLSAQGNPAARDLVRHAFAGVGGDGKRARAWARFAAARDGGADRDLLDRYGAIDAPVLLLWAERDGLHPVEPAREALDLLPDAQLRVLDGAGFLLAYDDPVGVARELSAFLG